MVDCELCRRAEMTPFRRLREDLFGRRPSPGDLIRHSMELYRAALGAGGWATDYERHRDAWVETGDLAELGRMLRHVT